jgi:hypothetical protein
MNRWGRLYCKACKRRACPECHRYADQHRSTCRYLQRQRRPPRGVVRNVVTMDELACLYLAYRASLIRGADIELGNEADAEDAVQEATLTVVRVLPLLLYLNIKYLRRAVYSSVLMTVRRRSQRGRDREIAMGSSYDLQYVEEQRGIRSSTSSMS